MNVSFAKFFPVIVAAFVAIFSPASGQTAPAPVPTSTSTPSAPAAGQIVPGATGTISPSQGVTPSTAVKAKAGKILDGALTPTTRKTLQQAMNAVTPPPADTNATVNPTAPANANAPAVTNAAPAAGH